MKVRELRELLSQFDVPDDAEVLLLEQGEDVYFEPLRRIEIETVSRYSDSCFAIAGDTGEKALIIRQ